MKHWAPFLFLALVTVPASADTAYKLPPKEIVDILDAPPTPQVAVNPLRDAMLLVDFEANPTIGLLARPLLRIAGLRIDPQANSRQRTLQYTALTVQRLDGSAGRRVVLPAGAKIGMPSWSDDGSRFAFARDLPDGVELWVGDAAAATAKALPGVRLNDVLGQPIAWMKDNRRLLVRLVPSQRGAPPAPPAVPAGPVVQETAGKVSQMATFQDLLKNPHDEALFQYHARTQLALVDATTGKVTPLGEPGLYTSVEFSPDERYLRVVQLTKPFSYRVTYFNFARSVTVWDKDGKPVATVADLPVADEVPRQGVPTGPRAVDWQPLEPATLVWAEALDGGDPLKKVPHRDRLMALSAPFKDSPRELLKVTHRFAGLAWTARKGEALLTEFDRDRRWRTTHYVDLASPATTQKAVFDLSVNDAYNDPGSPAYEISPGGDRVMAQDGDAIYLSGSGATPAGDRPFLDKLDLKTLKKERLHRSDETSLERFTAFVSSKGTRGQILTRYESPTEPPNYYVLDLASGRRTRVTDFKDPAPQLARVKKELIKYARKDGVGLSGTLYLPPDHQPGTRLPLLIWAYPLEYSDPDTAGQVRASPNAFTRIGGASPLFFVLRGYAVLENATMPVVGDPETVNNTYVEQIGEAAKAAIDTLDARGLIDPKRVVISGHSYGAFMTANLLAHTDLFAAGIARSGAYNRSLTPFGFQSERRSYWEATDLYTKMSPFAHAHKIKEPILLIHGEADNNSGTFPIQSERLFDALRGNGGTARLVMLPHESHGYRARESVLHVVAEMLEWADRYTKPEVNH
jgi:dipeptidyl aminopeptidase/acylaminoacyl peptidase